MERTCLQMFESTGWILDEYNTEHSDKYDLVAPTIVKPPKGNNLTQNMNDISEIGIVQQYQFSSSLQRMSVIVRVFGSETFRAYTKGSPEMILSLSKPETIPKDIMFCLKRYTEQGYRVIAMGRTELPENSNKVNEKEKNNYCFAFISFRFVHKSLHRRLYTHKADALSLLTTLSSRHATFNVNRKKKNI